MSPLPGRQAELRLRPSRVVWACLVFSVVAFVALGVYGVIVGGVGTPALGLLVVGLGLGAAAVWDLPWVTEIDADGVRRRSLAREQRVGWDDVVSFERRGNRHKGALVLRTVERRRIALTDVVERPDEWDRLRELAGRYAAGVSLPDPPRGHPFVGGW